MTTMTQEQLKNELSNFSGSENFYQHFFCQGVYTDGVKFLADSAEAHWMIDVIFSYLHLTKNEEFQTWTFRKTGESSGAMFMSDGNGSENLMQEFDFTDFPIDEMKFYFVRSEYGFTLMLPSEY